jgi:hypothetical protein
VFLNACTFWDCLSKSGGLFVFNVFNVFNIFKYLKTLKKQLKTKGPFQAIVFNVFKYLKRLKRIKNKGSFSGNCF